MLDANQNCLQSIAKNESNLGADQLSCLIDLVQPETDENCKLYLQQMELIIFSDYRLINNQNNTIQCLQNHLDQLASVCHDEIIKISELQSNDIHLDKPLFLACRADHHPDMDDDCKKKMIEREMLISKDYKISRSLEQSCKHHIKSFECRKNAKGRKQIRLSQILLCLEGAHAKGLLIVPECKAEMLLHRRFLFENYKLTPDLVSYCHRDIERFCSNVEFGAKTLHCLMKNVRPNRRRGDAHLKQRISNECERQIEDLLKEVNIAEDWRVDPILQQACQSTVNELCSNIRPGDGRILSCLADHIESARMADDCREYLHQMQYFISRNFELDTEIYEACQSDALKYCHAKSSWNSNDFDPERGPTVIGCLYRYVYQLDFKIQLQPKCIFHIKRVMKNRAASVDLLPFIEIPCIQDLAKFCSSEQVEKKGYEMELVKELCVEEYENSNGKDSYEVIECLIKKKNHFRIKSNRKCHQAIEHYQKINSEDFHFDHRFKESCKMDIQKIAKIFAQNMMSSIVYQYWCIKMISNLIELLER
ncbi:Golgi apparatus protein 1 [Sarcoptes scabiei]|uniref:Golgi apparatus protein 1 n=1 Tax=Sarcoptes scabiei TaxID=52283 RepID=A0A834VG67_SARSC|nr:Golgi apparatus protein 1 [Sarcoptes scabiei]